MTSAIVGQRETVEGRLVLRDEVVPGRLRLEDGWIVAVEEDPAAAAGPYIAPGLIDVHLHGFGGFDGTGGVDALAGMARALLRHGVTAFVPTAPSLPLQALAPFVRGVESWQAEQPEDGAQVLGANLEGPCLAPSRKGAHAPELLRQPDDLSGEVLAQLGPGLRIMTVAPELPGATALIRRLAARGVRASLGHSAATFADAEAGFAAGAVTTTHLFNAMSGVDHRAPGLAVAALARDDAYVELIADGIHVAPSLWPVVARSKPADRLLLVSDALPIAGLGDGDTRIGGLNVSVRDGRATLSGTDTLAGSVIALDSAVPNLVASGVPLPRAVAAATANPAELLGLDDRGRLESGRRADLILLDDDLRVLRVRRGTRWVDGPAR